MKFTREMNSLARRGQCSVGPNFELGRVAYGVPAGLTERGEMSFHAQQDAAGSRPRSVTLLLDVRPAGFTHGGGLHQRLPALFMEILEMRFDAFGEKISLRSCGVTELCHVARASRNDRNILPESRGG